jgi:hypothetical protein
MRSTTLPTLACSVTCWFLTMSGASAADLSPEMVRIIQAQRDTVAAITSAHVVVEHHYDLGDGKLSRQESIEWWRSGDRERLANVTYASMDGETQGWRTWDPPLRTETGYDLETVLSLDNWDSDQIPDEPLVPGGPNVEAYARTKGSVMPRDPAYASPGFFYFLLFMPFVTHDLREMAEAATEAKIISQSPEEIVLELRGDPFIERRLIALAPNRGHWIKRLTLYERLDDAEPVRTFEAVEFKDCGDGIFFPMHVEGRTGGALVMDVRVTEAQINEPIDPLLATVRFPEGARVDNLVTGQLHVWGKSEPELTFASLQDFREWEASTAQSLVDKGQGGGMYGSLWPYLVANGVLLGLVAVIIYIRRRLHPSRKQAS